MTSFKEPGSLPKPRLVGRIARLIFASVLLCFFFLLVTNYRLGSVLNTKDIAMWIGFAYCFYAFSHTINIGFGRNWKRWPQVIYIIILSLAMTWDYFLYKNMLAVGTSLALISLAVYVTFHVGLSHLISAFLTVPG